MASTSDRASNAAVETEALRHHAIQVRIEPCVLLCALADSTPLRNIICGARAHTVATTAPFPMYRPRRRH